MRFMMMRAEHFTVLRRKPVEVKHTMSRIKIQYHFQLIESFAVFSPILFQSALIDTIEDLFFSSYLKKKSVHFWGLLLHKGPFLL